ncbi:hypothetical protein [Solirubrum puertoriconensis]|uniref:DUF4168 domain-containing protein n=1 Tax=Solirubrum puertoriconensis TaxID=1751427 RepID=A0A9X0HIT3_SOLP1|nr:hypothetical protein [Solirubrum puertoriconensis]KUG06639.1 hypothetical protein ASU33_04665 [Solirubrum puertoriconensis]
MKKLFLSAVLACCFTGAFAQGGGTLSQKAAEATRVLTPQLGLDDARILKVKSLTYQRLQQEQEVERMYAGDQDVRKTKLQAVADEYHSQLKAVLTPAQLLRYEQLVASTATAATPAQAVAAQQP